MNTRKRTRLCQHCGGVNPLAASHCAYCSAGLVGYEDGGSAEHQNGNAIENEPIDAGFLEASLYEQPPQFSSHNPSVSRSWRVGEDPLSQSAADSVAAAAKDEFLLASASSVLEDKETLKKSTPASQKNLQHVPPRSADTAMPVEEDLFASLQSQEKQSAQKTESVSQQSPTKIARQSSHQQELPGMPPGHSTHLPPLSSTSQLPQDVSQILTEGENAELLSRHEGLIFDDSLLSKSKDSVMQAPVSFATNGRETGRENTDHTLAERMQPEKTVTTKPGFLESEMQPIYSVFDQPEIEKMGHLKKQVTKNENLIGSTYTQQEKGSPRFVQHLVQSLRNFSSKISLLSLPSSLVAVCKKGGSVVSDYMQGIWKAISSGAVSSLFSYNGKKAESTPEYRVITAVGLSIFGQLALIWSACLIFFSQDGEFTLTWQATTWPLFLSLGLCSLWLGFKMVRDQARDYTH